MAKFENIFLDIGYVHREDDRREVYSKMFEKWEKKQLGEVTIHQALTYKAPAGMTKREVATLVSYYLHEYLRLQKRFCRVKERHVSEAIADDIFCIQFVNEGIKEMFKDLGFVSGYPKTEEEAQGMLRLQICDTYDKGLAKSDAAKNFAQWKDLYEDRYEVDRLLKKYFVEQPKGAEK